ncbi:sulfite exporter TauE/SafE family protein [Effusibacillus dendaii]|uniref:Probable membrane transporter protein n=1 Tax=Effusibacillus dendaii TaxID=2743772 RepID=A0A7I8D761_9BACL|nr:sulfite exporter TauE/SafE family protein [Effusibacillus dendaii]BCJ86003.1 UPF0721 transmembrane protein [Effusibacillus dendaii]
MDIAWMDHLELLLIGIMAGFSGSLVGLGGAFIIIPTLVFLYNFPPQLIIGTSMAVLFFNSISSSYTYSRQRKIDFKSGFGFAMAMIPGSVIGAFVAESFSSKAFYVIYGIILLCVAGFLLWKPDQPVKKFLSPTITRSLTDVNGITYTYSYHRGFALIASFFIGFISSLLGIGGGAFLVPIMVLLLGFPPHIATATSMFAIMLSAVIGTASHAALQNVMWLKVLFLAPGAFIGGQLGARTAAKLKGKTIMRILACLLIVIAFRLILKS